jgi:hypothetical protein
MKSYGTLSDKGVLGAKKFLNIMKLKSEANV